MTPSLLAQFYSWYMYPEDESEFGKAISSASHINDVNDDPVVIVDGLTKVRLPLRCLLVVTIDVCE